MTSVVAVAATSQPWSPPWGHFQVWPASVLGERLPAECRARWMPGSRHPQQCLILFGWLWYPSQKREGHSRRFCLVGTVSRLITAPLSPSISTRAQEDPGCFMGRRSGTSWVLLVPTSSSHVPVPGFSLVCLSCPNQPVFSFLSPIKRCKVLSSWFFRWQSGIE